MRQDHLGDFIQRGLLVVIIIFLAALGLTLWPEAAAAEDHPAIPLLTPVGENLFRVDAANVPEPPEGVLTYLCVRKSLDSTEAACLVIKGSAAIVVPVKITPGV